MRELYSTRIIPAYAGSTPFLILVLLNSLGSSPHTRGARKRARWPHGRWGDHPRIRGEHRIVNVVLIIVDGIIPAYAGSTRSNLNAAP